jgi:ferrous iron transport protein B
MNRSSADGCSGCPYHNAEGLRRLGINTRDVDYVLALAGNPNTGKSTVFNALTGLRQHTGNWPGKTVTRAEGGFTYNGDRFRLVDLPGTYSLLATSADEEVARDFILFGRPDVTITVVDAPRLERNLNLVLQVLEITDRVVVCLNLMDEAERNGIRVDERVLSRDLGVPVVPTAARNGTGLDLLITTIDSMARGEIPTRPHRISFIDPTVHDTIDSLAARVTEVYPNLPNPRWVALRLLEGDRQIVDRFAAGTIGTDLTKYAVQEGEEPRAINADET